MLGLHRHGQPPGRPLQGRAPKTVPGGLGQAHRGLVGPPAVEGEATGEQIRMGCVLALQETQAPGQLRGEGEEPAVAPAGGVGGLDGDKRGPGGPEVPPLQGKQALGRVRPSQGDLDPADRQGGRRRDQ